MFPGLHRTKRPTFTRMLATASVVLFLGGVVGSPIVDPSCLALHGQAPGQAHAEHSTTGHEHHGSASLPDESAGSGHDDSAGATTHQCLCCFAGVATPPPSFDGAGHTAPAGAEFAAPRTLALPLVPFALPFANGPPALI